jgi:hypothetical protein
LGQACSGQKDPAQQTDRQIHCAPPQQSLTRGVEDRCHGL